MLIEKFKKFEVGRCVPSKMALPTYIVGQAVRTDRIRVSI